MNWLDTLYRELDEWNYDGVAATFWWRDDDAQAATNALDALLAHAQRYDAPISLAVIPDGLNKNLCARIDGLKTVTVLQHGIKHENHAPSDEKKMELGNHRPAAVMHRQLADGFQTLTAAFGAQFLPVLVPPWNRMDDALLDDLPQLGFVGVSTFTPRTAHEKLRVVNTHVDIINWKGHKTFAGEQAVADAIVAHLTDRRAEHCDSGEPTGLLTHHLVHDARCREFLVQLLAALDEHPAVKWVTAARAFGIS